MEPAIGKDRLSSVDDVRSLVIFLVVMLHASVTYSGIGGWYVIENKSESLDMVSLAVFGLFNSFNQAWFMGVLFFFGGFFASDSLERKGVSPFIKDRLLRLGVPLLGFVLVINPLMAYFVAFPEQFRGQGNFLQLYFGRYIGTGEFLSQTGPLWFVEILLVFSLILIPAKKVCARFEKKDGAEARKAPSVPALLGLILVTAVSAFAVRIFAPIGTSWMNLQFCFFPSYIALFILGVRGASGRWFARITSGKNSAWFLAATAIGIPCWAAIIVLGGVLDGNMALLNGGLTLQSASYSLWESFTAVGMSLGLTAVFANRRVSAPGAVSRFFSRNSFSVYVFHPVFLIGLTKLLSAWAVPPLAKALLVGTAAFSATALFSELIVRRIPFVKKYF